MSALPLFATFRKASITVASIGVLRQAALKKARVLAGVGVEREGGVLLEGWWEGGRGPMETEAGKGREKEDEGEGRGEMEGYEKIEG